MLTLHPRARVVITAGAVLAATAVVAGAVTMTQPGQGAAALTGTNEARTATRATAAQTPRTTQSVAQTPNRPTASRLKSAAPSTSIRMQFTNNTHEAWQLVSASRGGTTGAHWQTQPPTMVSPGQIGQASSESNGEATMTLIYKMVTTGANVTMKAETPFVGSNSSSASTSGNQYFTTTHTGSSNDPLDTFNTEVGTGVSFSGSTSTWTVPPGVNTLKIYALGGGTAGVDGKAGSSGALVIGDLPVTPGQQLLLGAGGAPVGSGGGWGPTVTSNNYSGGNTNSSNSQAGAGASVVADAVSGTVYVVAGGGGGSAGGHSCDWNQGGVAGFGGWTGSNGGGTGGGKAGGNSATQGADNNNADACAGGAGGGGANGGQAGTDTVAGGGGAGSSAQTNLESSQVAAANNAGNNGEIVIYEA